MEYLIKLEKTLCRELEDRVRDLDQKQRMSSGDREAIKDYLEMIKDAGKVIDKKMGSGYSRDGHWQAEGQYSHDNSYGHYVRGHYSNENDSSYDGYSRRMSYDDYSQHGNDEMRATLQNMMGKAKTEPERNMIRRWMNELPNR